MRKIIIHAEIWITDAPAAKAAPAPQRPAPPMPKAQKVLLELLEAAAPDGLTLELWNSRARAAGIGVKRRADLAEARKALLARGLVSEKLGRWRHK
jgi:hypothetical protein